ncbi:MAG: hypothetical protein JKY22_12265 [Flavobacteriaceae bacterium]|nr:hypothetical protein [Flavobacteriaceae bacterium]
MIRKNLKFGVGINDAEYKIQINGVNCPYYSRWSSMLERCYSEKAKEYNLSYKDCYVCDDWLHFSNFRKWMMAQDWKGKELDKDILVQGNKVYSPDNCVFIPKIINNILVRNRRTKSQFLVGVGFNKRSKRFNATCSINNKANHIGCFKTELEAHEAYKGFKYNYIAAMAEKQPEPVRSSLLRWVL